MQQLTSETIQQAYDYLKKRTIPPEKFNCVNRKEFRTLHWQGVVIASDVFAVMEMLISGEFDEFRKQGIEMGHDAFI